MVDSREKYLMAALTISSDVDHFSLCLDFANTMVWHTSDQPVEKLNHYSDLVAWAYAADLLASDQAEQLNELAQQHPIQAASTLATAIAVREAIYGIVVAYVNGRSPTTSDLTTFNTALSHALAQSQLTTTAGRFIWSWQTAEAALDAMLWPIVHSAAELLTTPEILARVGQCADDRGCGYLFLDVSKNRSRRWCDINDCGNRAKQRRYYQRQHKANQA
jgi:predicted RNA-binding Zn ribbon-like protein